MLFSKTNNLNLSFASKPITKDLAFESCSNRLPNQSLYLRCCCRSPPAPAPAPPTSPSPDYSRLVAHHWKATHRPTVPPWLCLLLLLSYLLLGSIIVASYTSVAPVDALHYCFSLLATIGVTRLRKEEGEDVVWVLLTSLYILLGVALVSMVLHLLQASISSLLSSLSTPAPHLPS